MFVGNTTEIVSLKSFSAFNSMANWSNLSKALNENL